MSTAMMERIVRGLEATDRRLAAMEKRESAMRADAETRARRQADYEDRERRRTEFAELQARADDVLGGFGERAPAPVANESRRAYTIRLLELIQKTLPPFLDKMIEVGNRKVNVADLADLPLRRLDDAQLAIFEPQLIAAAVAMQTDNDSVLPGETRIRKYLGPTGHEIKEARGRRSFVIDMQSPSMRVMNWADRDGRFPRN